MKIGILKISSHYWAVCNFNESDPFKRYIFTARSKKKCIEYMYLNNLGD